MTELDQTIRGIFEACQHAGPRDAHYQELRACWQCGNAAGAAYRQARKEQLASRPKDCLRCGARPHTFIVNGWTLCGRCKTATMKEHHAAQARAGVLGIFATAPLVDTTTWAARRSEGKS